MISIATAKRIREELGLTHLVIFGVDSSGQQHVATHGETRANAFEAAEAGDRLKGSLGWPENLRRSKPMERICKNCAYFELDRGVFCINGWSGGDSGWCRWDPSSRSRPPRTQRDSTCGQFEPNG